MPNEFRDLFETHYNTMCRIAYRILLEQETSREIVQEVFIDLWRHQKWNEIRSVKAYLYVAVHNRAISELKKRKPFVSETALVDYGLVDQHPNELKELEVIINGGIETLPEQCKKIFLLSREDELSYSEIAGQLGLSIKTVERQIGIALQKLREYLDTHWSK